MAIEQLLLRNLISNVFELISQYTSRSVLLITFEFSINDIFQVAWTEDCAPLWPCPRPFPSVWNKVRIQPHMTRYCKGSIRLVTQAGLIPVWKNCPTTDSNGRAYGTVSWSNFDDDGACPVPYLQVVVLVPGINCFT